MSQHQYRPTGTCTKCGDMNVEFRNVAKELCGKCNEKERREHGKAYDPNAKSRAEKEVDKKKLSTLTKIYGAAKAMQDLPPLDSYWQEVVEYSGERIAELVRGNDPDLPPPPPRAFEDEGDDPVVTVAKDSPVTITLTEGEFKTMDDPVTVTPKPDVPETKAKPSEPIEPVTVTPQPPVTVTKPVTEPAPTPKPAVTLTKAPEEMKREMQRVVDSIPPLKKEVRLSSLEAMQMFRIGDHPKIWRVNKETDTGLEYWHTRRKKWAEPNDKLSKATGVYPLSSEEAAKLIPDIKATGV